jgi:hypothetical protein
MLTPDVRWEATHGTVQHATLCLLERVTRLPDESECGAIPLERITETG